MLRIYLARHGQDEDNASGILNGRRNTPLTEKGRAQAAEVAQKIKETHIRFTQIYCSPLQRAAETAQTIAGVIGAATPIVLQDLIERDFGVMSGKSQKDIEALCAPHILKTDTINYFLQPAGAETFPELLQRAEKVLGEIQSLHTEGNILLVSHGDFGKMLYAAFYHLDWMDVLKFFHFGNAELLELSSESSAEDTHVFKIQQHNS